MFYVDLIPFFCAVKTHIPPNPGRTLPVDCPKGECTSRSFFTGAWLSPPFSSGAVADAGAAVVTFLLRVFHLVEDFFILG